MQSSNRLNFALLALTGVLFLVACGPDLDLDEQGRYLVTTGSDDGEGSLRYVLTHAPANAVIYIDPSIQVIALEERLQIERNTTIIAGSEEHLILRGASNGALLVHEIVSFVEMENIAFEDAGSTALTVYADFTLRNGAFRRNGTQENALPGAIEAFGGIRLIDVELEENFNTFVRSQGGSFFHFENTTFKEPTDQTGDPHRGFLIFEGTVTENALIKDSTFEGNRKTIAGVTYGGGANLLVENSTFSRHRLASGNRGGGLLVFARSGEEVTIRDVEFTANGDVERAGPNGGLTVVLDGGATLHVEDALFRENRARGRAAGLHIEGADNGETVVIRNAQFQENRTGGTLGLGGGALFLNLGDSAKVLIESSLFSGNEATDAASALQITTQGSAQTEIDVQIFDTAFTGNGLESRSGTVRTAFNDSSTIHIEGSLFHGNFSNSRGTALAIGGGQRLTVLNSTFANNRNYDTATLYSTARDTALAFVTLVNNTHDQGGALLLPSGPQGFELTLYGSLLAGNTPSDIANPDAAIGTNLDLQFNVIGEFHENTDMIDFSDLSTNLVEELASSGIGVVSANGGPTSTVALDTNHLALGLIDEADCLDHNGVALAVDQRRSARPVDGKCTAGAWEQNP